MPGRLESLTAGAARGWAAHPRHVGYPMLVHVLARGRVVASGLAAQGRPDGRLGFTLQLDTPTPPPLLQVMLAETDEYLDHPARHPPGPRPPLTVEDLVATPSRRPWVNGGCHVDAVQAGLLPETIIDLICRDYLGQPAGPVALASALAIARRDGLDAVRRSFLQAGQYRARRLYADAAPGAIFSQALVLRAAAGDFVPPAARTAHLQRVSARPLMQLQGEAFLQASYRAILRKEADRDGLSHYLQKMTDGMSRGAVIRHFANEFETINAGILVVDLPEE